MSSKNQAVKALRQLFEHKKSEYDAPGRLLIHLDNETDGKFGPAIIELALESMERRREVVLHRAGKVFNGVKYTPKSKPAPPAQKAKLDLTPIPVPPKEKREVPKPSDIAAKKSAAKQPWSPLDRRTRELTRGIPDYLEDHHCSPVTVTKMATLPPPTELPSDSGVGGIQGRLTSVENLQLAIKVLRKQCDDSGVLQADSGYRVLEEELGLPQRHAIYVFGIIGKMGYKASVRVGKGWKTIVEMEPEEPQITEEMVTEAILNLTRSRAKVVRVDIAGEDTVKDTTPEPHATTDQPETFSTPDEIVARMAAIIQQLEAENAAKDQKIRELEEFGETLIAEKEALEAEKVSLNAEIAQLHEQVNDRNLLGSTVADILHRYPK